MATSNLPKPILKESSYPATPKTATRSTISTPSREERDRQTALYHARILQTRKQVELDILSATEKLLDYPLAGPPYDSSNPSPEDAKAFKDFLKPFQPTDYDALILERNISDDCGYVLCKKKRQKDLLGGKYRIIGTRGKAKDFKVVEKGELEKWCSEACAKKALYIRVQLSESPAWERDAAQSHIKIDLLDEPKCVGALVGGLEKMNLDEGTQSSDKDREDLALERGDRGLASQKGLVDVKILDKDIKREVESPSLEGELSGKLNKMHLSLEGHTPRFDNRMQIGTEDEEDTNTDWKL
jgi:RNA polymerase II-associated protein 2